MKLLRLTNTINATSAPYNQFSLRLKETIDETVCSLLKHDVKIDKDIEGFHGEGSIFIMLKLVKRLIIKNDYDVIHIHSGLTGIIFIIAIFPFRLSLLKKTLFTLHNSWNVLKLRNQILDFIVMLVSRRVCTCGLSSRDSIPRIVNFFVGKKTIAIINGFDHDRIDRVEKEKLAITHFDSNSKIKILCVGALNNTKNQISLLEALKTIDMEAEVIFLGDGANRQTLIGYSKSISDSIKITFKGRVSRDLAIEHMFEADISISLSKGEGLPIAILESMYAGCYMILSKIPPHTEISPPSERCFFVDLYKKEQILNSLYYVRDNIGKTKKSRNISREYSIANFSVNNMLRDYKKVYKSISEDIPHH
jgi:glycosyltransferase involved in cell wall biosynthesis|tara:strand:- start:584 stop:1675 length:1092 start_codon:yes stop_codon:yes gene_type:complete